MEIKTLDDINKLTVSDAETDSVEYKETTGHGNTVRLSE